MRYAVLLVLCAVPAFGQVNLGSPVPLPPATNIASNPHFAAMQKQAAASGRDVYMRLHEQGAPAPRWFKCDPQGWISYSDLPPGSEPIVQPRRSVAANRPFSPGTTGTTVPNADTSPQPAREPGSYGPATPTAYTYMPALNVVRSGNMTGNGCPPSG